MTDWKALAAARCPDIPPDAAARIAPSLEGLESAFRPLTAQLTPDIEPAVTFSAAAGLGGEGGSAGSEEYSSMLRSDAADAPAAPGKARL